MVTRRFTTALFLKFVFMGYYVVSGNIENDSLVDREQALLSCLLSDYHHTLRPAQSKGDNVTVHIGMSLFYLEKVRWKDFRLSWNASEYPDIEALRIPIEKIWMPDIDVFNRLYTGLTCAFDISEFPFDSHTCFIKLGSRTHGAKKVDVKVRGFGRQEYIDNTEFDLTNISYKRNSEPFESGLDTYVDVQFFMYLRRRTAYSTHLFVAPAVVMSLLMPCLFLIPPDSREKLMFGTGILIGHILMFGQLMQFVPQAYPRMPIIGAFFLANIVLVCLSLAIIIVNVWTKGKRRQTVPAFINTVFLGVFGRLLCVRREDYFPDEEQKSESGNPSDVDKDQILQSNSRLATTAQWRQLAVVLDRMLCISLFVIVVIVAIALCRP